MCKYKLAAEAHKNVYGKELNPEKIKQEVLEKVNKSKGTLAEITESGAFVEWMDELKLKDEYKKLKKEANQKKGENVVNGTFAVVESHLGDPDIIEVFGATGSLKTFIAYNWIISHAKEGKKCFYIDTERNMTKSQREKMKKANVGYACIINFNKLVDFVKNKLPKDYDYIVLDSVGLPALGNYAISSMKGKGDVLLNVQAMLYILKDYAVQNNCYVLVTNQPTSEMNKSEYINYNGKRFIATNPFGDKGSFFVKEIYRTVLIQQTQNKTVVDVVAWRSREVGKLTRICRVVREGEKITVSK
jgi:hypothetical protein